MSCVFGDEWCENDFVRMEAKEEKEDQKKQRMSVSKQTKKGSQLGSPVRRGEKEGLRKD